MWFKIAISIFSGLIIIGLLVLLLRKNEAIIEPKLDIKIQTVVHNKWHNSNTSITYWKEQFWLVFTQSPFHFFSPRSKVRVLRSVDGLNWIPTSEFQLPGIDVRDPKLAVIRNKLFIYFYKSAGANPLPYMTAYTFTTDGMRWSEICDVDSAPGWLIWTPKTLDNLIWYASAHRIKEGKTKLFSTFDGINFTPVSVSHIGKTNLVDEVVDESDFGFGADGSIISTQRLEFSDNPWGDRRAGTNLTRSQPPYLQWEELGQDHATRLDGPSLFSYKDQIYASGRRHVDTKGIINHKTSIFTRKRTAVYLVSTHGLIHLTDLPSSGDTAYCGTVIHQGNVYISYYTSNPRRDWPWIFGMCVKSMIQVAKIDLQRLDDFAKQKQAEILSKSSTK